MEQVKSLLNRIATFIKDTFDEIHQRREQQKQAQKKKAIYDLGMMMFNGIQYDLFSVLRCGQYSYLKPIQLPMHVRQDYFIVRNNAYIFYYQLEAYSVPARSILNFERQKYNTDINQFMQDQFNTYGEWAYQLYPYIMHGMKVISADPYPTSIKIGVSFPVPTQLSCDSNCQKTSGNLYLNGGSYYGGEQQKV